MPFSRPKSAARTRGQPLAALTTAVDTLVDEEEEEMTPEQIKAEKQAALQSMHTFGGASRGPPTIKSPAAASGPGPRASFPFGQQPKAGIAAANPSGGATPSAIQSAQHSELSEEPKHGATIFGRLGTPSSTPPPNLQTAQVNILHQHPAASLFNTLVFSISRYVDRAVYRCLEMYYSVL